MKTDNLRHSNHIEDRRGQSLPGSSFNRSRAGTGLLFQLLFSRGNWKTKLIGLVLLIALGGGTGLSGMLGGMTGISNYQSTNTTTQSGTIVSDEEAQFISKVLGSTEDYWTQEFKKNNLTYEAPTLVFYQDQTQTACGIGQAQSGPFYCSADKKVYLDLSFYDDLSSKYGATGDFAMAYVIAHEVGHHVQNELGTMAQYSQARRGKSEKEANKLNVRLELQADYYAGAWANYVKGENLLDAGDIDEAMTAAHAVGDDHLQEQAYGHSMPDSFTHGTSEQRKRWFDKGYQYGDIQHGNTFEVAESSL